MARKTSSAQVAHFLPSVPLPVPYGAHVVESGVQFSIFSRHATRVWLLLFDRPGDATPRAEIELSPETNRVGDIWHVHVQDARPGDCYVYRMDGKPPPGHANFFNPAQWLLDPYAQCVAGREHWGDTRGLQAGSKVQRGSMFPKGVIVRDEFDWSNDVTPGHKLADTVIYELHLRGFTADPSSNVSHAGTYRGLIEKIPYLKSLGVTTVELLPVQEFNEMEFFLENTARKDLRNFWGYSTQAFFAPNGRYSSSGVYGQQLTEFKEMVMALHRADIEVILDVVFNHTGEAGDHGPCYSFRGIDNSIYYMMEGSGDHYANYSGCGNTINSNHPIVRDFVLSCLRYWALHMHVDGFRFDLASVFARDQNGNLLPNPPLIEHIAEDPALRHTKLIAEAWDAVGTYHVGNFPSARWSEWNGRFRDDVRRFWAGERGMLGALATRLTGSSDLYQKDGQTPLKSINFITSHDGFTLADLVSFAQKHNEANMENNRDGDPRNFSRNHGVEGATSDDRINSIRLRQQKNLLATLFLSQGVPMMLAGDEFSRTQRGNNNAYCQDNEISWVDWNLIESNSDLLRFAQELVSFRAAHPSLRRATFFRGEQHGKPDADIRWYGPHGGGIDWQNGLTIACLINGNRDLTGAETDDDHIFIAINGEAGPTAFKLPPAPGQPWQIAFTTQQTPPPPPSHDLPIDAHALTVLISPRKT